MMWEQYKLSQVCKIISGNSVPAKKKEELFVGVEGMPYVATKDVGFDGSIDYQNGIFIPDEHLRDFKISPVGATLVCAEGGSAGRKIAFSSEKCCYVNKLFSLQASEIIFPKFLYYYALSGEFHSQFKEAMHGLIGGVSLSKIKDFTISAPPIAEQQRIVAKLDATFAGIDETIETTQKIIESAETNLANIIDAKTLGGANWAEFKVNDLGQVQTGNTPKTSQKENYGVDVPFVKPPHFNSDGSIKVAEDGLSHKGAEQSRIATKNSVLMVCIGATIGKVGINKTNVCFNQQINSLTPLKQYDAELIYWQMRGRRFQNEVLQNAGQATLPIISKSKWQNLSIFLPKSLEEQIKIRKLLRKLNTQTENLVNNKNKKLEHLNALKSAILRQELQSEAA